jgi:hypothetical protein
VGTRQAYVFNALGGTTLQIQLPVDAPLGPTILTVGASAPFNITLVQYCPGLPVPVPAPNFAFAFHYPAQMPVTSSFRASPNEQITVMATGLGPTNTVFHSGQVAERYQRRNHHRAHRQRTGNSSHRLSPAR